MTREVGWGGEAADGFLNGGQRNDLYLFEQAPSALASQILSRTAILETSSCLGCVPLDGVVFCCGQAGVTVIGLAVISVVDGRRTE